ncbi:hypothetical protein [Roseateles sp. LYH14W]|uniref:ABC transporter permease n=1 Tax=Pelomonas parva TaxID=3299032 RepID=A0ABW7F2G7_9BURK
MNTHIPTLLQREWMQHKRGWLIAALTPPLLFLALLLIPKATVQGLPTEHLSLTALGIVGISTMTVYGICLLFGMFQLPGLTRRDTQDRSIEFWLSLPGRPSESVAATVLAHGWLAPLGGLLAGAVLGVPLAAAIIAKQTGLDGAMSVHWGEVVIAGLPVLLRVVAGSLLALLWLLPVIATLMAASAWLKRLGVPLVLVGGSVAVVLLKKVYDIGWPAQALESLAQQIGKTLVHHNVRLVETLQSGDNLATWALRDFGGALAELASLQFLGWTAVAAAGFALVVAKRARGG